MSDYIKREDAIKEIQRRIDSPYMQEPLQQGASRSCLGAIMDIPSADVVERKRGEWIPCSERLPKVGETVLVWMGPEFRRAPWETKRRIEFGRLSDDRGDADGPGWEWLDESGANYWEADWNGNIIAWMPLPKDYEPDLVADMRGKDED